MHCTNYQLRTRPRVGSRAPEKHDGLRTRPIHPIDVMKPHSLKPCLFSPCPPVPSLPWLWWSFRKYGMISKEGQIKKILDKKVAKILSL
jgi:hypothetical protein